MVLAMTTEALLYVITGLIVAVSMYLVPAIFNGMARLKELGAKIARQDETLEGQNKSLTTIETKVNGGQDKMVAALKTQHDLAMAAIRDQHDKAVAEMAKQMVAERHDQRGELMKLQIERAELKKDIELLNEKLHSKEMK